MTCAHIILELDLHIYVKAAEMGYFYLSNICKHVANTKMRPRLQVSNINIIFMFANVCADCIQIYLRSIFAVV